VPGKPWSTSAPTNDCRRLAVGQRVRVERAWAFDASTFAELRRRARLPLQLGECLALATLQPERRVELRPRVQALCSVNYRSTVRVV